MKPLEQNLEDRSAIISLEMEQLLSETKQTETRLVSEPGLIQKIVTTERLQSQTGTRTCSNRAGTEPGHWAA